MDLVGLLKSQFLCHLVFCYVFIASGLIVNTIQLLTLLLWPINKQLFRKINCRLSYCISSQLVLLLEWWSGTECVIYTDPQAYPKYGKENAIVVLNHKFEIDFLCGWSLAERFGVLGGSKVLAKKELAYVPIIGWMWYFTEMVFCTRKWEQDRKTVSKSLLHLRDYPEKYFFLIHCEGTRFTEKKHQISMQVAQAKGLPSLKHHLLPRTKGFAVTVRSLRNVVSAVYDCTLNFRNNENPTLLGVLNGKKYHADLYVRRIPLEEVPEDEAECSAWLHKLYQEKHILIVTIQYILIGREEKYDLLETCLSRVVKSGNEAPELEVSGRLPGGVRPHRHLPRDAHGAPAQALDARQLALLGLAAALPVLPLPGQHGQQRLLADAGRRRPALLRGFHGGPMDDRRHRN
ncbi:1-acyl-sn-glycerol-3-phosphate acyltransferase delta isoform X2 [Vicugna pacos]|uniref:1-acyl-sn-glycerol-3-phosphate acyltransferase delta n=1 Tax=Vicugna pacos TaxID=30538 RepID=A0ABM5DMW8_VICPA